MQKMLGLFPFIAGPLVILGVEKLQGSDRLRRSYSPLSFLGLLAHLGLFECAPELGDLGNWYRYQS